MDVETLRHAVAQADIAALGIGLASGFVFSFNPVALAAVPVSLAYVAKAPTRRQAVCFGGMFVLGMILTHVLLGLAASLGGAGVQRLLGRAWGLLLGPWLILLGLVWAGWLRVPWPALNLRAKPAVSAWSAFALGIPFAVAICPYCTPALLVLLGVAAGIGSPVFGATLLLAFALGRALPILLGAVTLGWLEHARRVQKSPKAFETIGGLLLIASGLYLLNAYFLVVPALAV